MKILFLLTLLITQLSILSWATRPDSNQGPTPSPIPSPKPDPNEPGFGGGGFFGPGGGFGMPGFDSPWGQGIIGGGYGYGSGGPKGGYSKSGTIRPSVVCKDKGPCFLKKITCPAKCFSSYSKSGKGFGGGGGGGGCTMDCQNKCIAYCVE